MCLLKNLSEGLPLPSWAWCWLIPKTAVLKFLSVKFGIFSKTSLIDLTVLSAGELLMACNKKSNDVQYDVKKETQ